MREFLRHSALIFPLFLMLCGTGCRSVKAPATAQSEWTPPAWATPVRAKDSAWMAIRKEQVDASKPLTLIDLIDLAMRHSPKTRQAWNMARAADAQKRQAESRYYPNVTVEGTGARAKTVADLPSAEMDQLSYGPDFKITWLLLDFGGRHAAVQQASQLLLAANFQFNQALQDLLQAVATAYYGLYSAQSCVEAAEYDVENAHTTLYTAQQKWNTGLGTRLDALQAGADYDKTLYALEDAKGQVKTAKAMLAQTMGLPADTEFDIAAPSKELPTELSEKDVSQLIEESLGMRPDIGAMRASLKAKKAAVAAAHSDLWPVLNAGGTGQKNWYQYYGADVNDGQADGYTGYLTLSWNIFDGFNHWYKRREAQANVDKEYEALKQAELAASAEVWTNYYGFNTAVQKFIYSQAYFDSAAMAYDLALQSYNAGLKSILDLLNSQSALASAGSKLIQSQKDVFVALANLAHAAGLLQMKKIDAVLVGGAKGGRDSP